jgi:3-oxoacid CoA-transferase subunit A
MINKVIDSFDQAVRDIPDGASVMMMHTAGPGGVPQNLILALRNHGLRELTIITLCNFGLWGGLRIKPGIRPYITPDILVKNGQVKKGIATWGRGDPKEESAWELQSLSGKVEAEIVPMGVLAHRIRAGGNGIPAFYSPVGIGTLYERGKEKRVINAKEYILEYALRSDFGFVRAFKADRRGNLIYRGTSRGSNSLIAKACDVTIAEVDEIVETGELDPAHIVTPGIYVDHIVKIPGGGLR